MIGMSCIEVGVSGRSFCRLTRTWPIRLGSKDARAVVVSTAPTTRVHRGAGRIICRRSIAAGSASAAIATAAGRG